MENAEERKKMKKIEKEEQLKKKLEQTMEEKMAADSKTVEGESAVVKAEEGNTATEQEAAPALSEEELNAMYERFQQRLQKEGLADAEGNPTEKTLEIRRQIVEKKAEREKQAERQKKIAKRAKTTKHWVRTAKAAGVVLVVGACVFGASMTSEANRIRLVETINGVRNLGNVTWTDNGENREYILSLLNSKIFKYIFGSINQTLNFQSGEVAKFPVILNTQSKINLIAQNNIMISRKDWDYFETSWDFLKNPLNT